MNKLEYALQRYRGDIHPQVEVFTYKDGNKVVLARRERGVDTIEDFVTDAVNSREIYIKPTTLPDTQANRITTYETNS